MPHLLATMKVDMDPRTARKLRDQAKLPSELRTWPHARRTREDPFAEVLDEVREQRSNSKATSEPDCGSR